MSAEKIVSKAPPTYLQIVYTFKMAAKILLSMASCAFVHLFL